MSARRYPLPALLVLLLIVAATGCAPVYIPNTAHTPMLREQGEVQVGGFATSNGLDAQAAVALTDRLGVVGGYSFSGEPSVDCPDLDCPNAPSDYRRHEFAEVGVGYTERSDDHLGLEFFAGYGRGKAKAVDTYYFFPFGEEEVLAEGRYNRYYAQPGVFYDDDWLQLSLTGRVSAVRFYELQSSEAFWSKGTTDIFFEPASTVRAGPDPFVFTVQTGLAIPLFARSDLYDYQPITISIGLNIRLDQFFR